jgi:hypothetical protein
MENRRKALRIPLITMARITPHGPQTSADAFVRDVSIEGIGVYVKGRYQQGDLLLVKVSFMVSQGETIKESLMGRVSWVKPLEEGYLAVGIQLPDMEQKNPKLYAYIRQLEVSHRQVKA